MIVKKIKSIIQKIESKTDLTNKEIEEILNNTSYVVVYEFTNCIGHLTLAGKNQMVRGYKDAILEELYRFVFWNENEVQK